MNETNHPARRLRHGQRPTEPLVFEDDAANKAAEEGGLPTPRAIMDVVDEFGSGTTCYIAEDLRAAIADAIAADRASRQVANKAEVEPVAWKVGVELFSSLEEANKNIRNPSLVPLPLYATPPATTGASTAKSIDTPEFQEMMAEWFNHDDAETAYSGVHWKSIVEHINKHNAGGASTVLTDERIDSMWREGVENNHFDTTDDYVRWFAREVAAQAGQVAVPEWISVDEQLPSSDLLPNGDCPSVIGLWKEGALASNLVQQMITNTAYLRNNPQNFTHWMPLPPSPAKESK